MFVNKIYLFILLITALLACNFQSEDAIYLDALMHLDYECLDGNSEYYLRGVIGDDSICIYHGVDDYKAYFAYGNGFTTTSNTFTLGDIQAQDSKSFISMGIYKKSPITDFLDRIRIKGPPQKFGTSLDSMVTAFLVAGEHALRKRVSIDSISTDGFEVLINKWYLSPEFDPNPENISMTSALGEQPADSHFTIHEIVLLKSSNVVEGHILFEVACNLYLNHATTNLNGEFAKNFSGTFRLPVRYER